MEQLKELKPQIMKDLEHPEKIDINRLKNYLRILADLADKNIEISLLEENEEANENKEISELYRERAHLPKENWGKASIIKDDILEKVLKSKENNGWKFKDEI